MRKKRCCQHFEGKGNSNRYHYTMRGSASCGHHFPLIGSSVVLVLLLFLSSSSRTTVGSWGSTSRIQPMTASAFVVPTQQKRWQSSSSSNADVVVGSSTTSLDSSSSSSISGSTSTTTTTTTEDTISKTTKITSLTQDLVSKLRYRELQRALEERRLPVSGTTAQLRSRLLDGTSEKQQQTQPTTTTTTATTQKVSTSMTRKQLGQDKENDFESNVLKYVTFEDVSDKDLEAKNLVHEITIKAKNGHWKSATRKLKTLTRRYPTYIPSQQTYEMVLSSCTANRLQGARASEPARKILEKMVESGYTINESVGNYCIRNCLGYTDSDSTHEGFGGIDTAYAMMSALQLANTTIQDETFAQIIVALSKQEGSILDSIDLLGKRVMTKTEDIDSSSSSTNTTTTYQPQLSTFAEIAAAAMKSFEQQIKKEQQQQQKQKSISDTTLAATGDTTTSTTSRSSSSIEQGVLKLLGYLKVGGYDLDNIASIQDGRTILAAAIVAAEMVDNVSLGLRLLTAASNVKVMTTTEDSNSKEHEKKKDNEDENAEVVVPSATDVEVSGDIIVANMSPLVQRSSTLLHKRAIVKAVDSNQWKLAIQLLDIMKLRNLHPNNWIWRQVTMCCIKNKKCKESVQLLLEWIKLSERGLKGDPYKPPITIFNTIINLCEIRNEEDLTVTVLDAMRKTHNTEGNIITFNIALKHLAKLGNYPACEGIIIGMLQANVEPTVVSYTTAIAACATPVGDGKQPKVAYEWIKRMRSRNVMPNVRTYDTALAACLDESIESTKLASQIATEMLHDINRQLMTTQVQQQKQLNGLDSEDCKKEKMIKSEEQEDGDVEPTNAASLLVAGIDEYADVLPDSATRSLARELLLQYEKNLESSNDEQSDEAITESLKQLSDFDLVAATTKAKQMLGEQRSLEDQDEPTNGVEAVLKEQQQQQVVQTTTANDESPEDDQDSHRSAEV